MNSRLVIVSEAQLPSSQEGRLTLLKHMGFSTDAKAIVCNDLESVLRFISEWNNTKLREDYPYLIDGVVIKVNDIMQQQVLGTNNRAPKWAVAYKFGSSKEVTQLLNISYQVREHITIIVIHHSHVQGGQNW